jgi:hypothetical protein
MRPISAEYHGIVTLKGIDRDVAICYEYDHDHLIEVGDCYNASGKKSALLQRSVELDLIGFLEEQSFINDCEMAEMYRDERDCA